MCGQPFYANEYVDTIPTIKKKGILCHRIRRNNVEGLLLEGPLEGNISVGRARMEWMTSNYRTGMR